MNDKPILILVNPRSGRGKSVRVLDNFVLPTLESQGIQYEVQMSEALAKVSRILSEINIPHLDRFKSIMVVSGDGLLYDTVNALMARSDWQDAMRVPLGIVPTGSGNGLAFTLLGQQHPHLRPGKEALRVCLQQAIQHESCGSDLVKITYAKGKKTTWSFLSLGWGLMSDIDVDSDWLRVLGELRFTIYGIVRLFTATSYKGKLAYLPKVPHRHETNLEPPNEPALAETGDKLDCGENKSSWTHIEDYFACLYAVHQSHISSRTKIAPASSLTDQTIYLTYVRGHLSVAQTLRFLLAIDDGTHGELPFVTVVPVERLIFEPLEQSKVVVDGDKIPWSLEDGPLEAEIVPSVLNLNWSKNLSTNQLVNRENS